MKNNNLGTHSFTIKTSMVREDNRKPQEKIAEDPEISIIVPAYNAEKYIEKCLYSLKYQTFQNFEVIVVNDGSTDSTLNIANNCMNSDKRFKIISQDNKKQGAARNLGIKTARGKYIGFIDADDFVENNYFEKLYNAIVKSESDIAVTNMLKHKKIYKKFIVKHNFQQIVFNINDKIKICSDVSHRFFHCTNKLYRRAFLQKNNIFFPEGRIYEDVIFGMKTIFYANKIISVPDTKYHYISHSSSTVKSKDLIGQKQQDHNIAYKELIYFAKEHNIVLPERLNYIESVWLNPLIKKYIGTYKIKTMLLGIIPISVKYYEKQK